MIAPTIAMAILAKSTPLPPIVSNHDASEPPMIAPGIATTMSPTTPYPSSPYSKNRLAHQPAMIPSVIQSMIVIAASPFLDAPYLCWPTPCADELVPYVVAYP